MEPRINSLEVALKNEMKEYEFYSSNAKRTKNTLGKAMFQQIASEELEHYQRLKELHERWTSRNKWPETIPLTVNGTIVDNILKDMINHQTENKKGDADDLNALKTAIAFETAGATFYKQLRDEVTDAREKEFFDLLAKIEHEHFLSLKDTEEYLTNPSSWYQKTERSGLDGA